MTSEKAAVGAKPVWVDLASADPAASRAFYAKLFGWQVEVNPDPQYGGYAIARIGGDDAAGIGPNMAPGAPTAWNLYIGTDDPTALAAAVTAAGGTVVMAPFPVGDQGSMAVFQDPTGAFISGWQAARMRTFATDGPGTYTWAELSARGIDRAIAFYRAAFGWTATTREMGPGQPAYTTFELDGEAVAGGMEMAPMVPAEVPSYWMVYFTVADVDAAARIVVESGGREIVGPTDFPGGRFAIVTDPQGATFGLHALGAQ